MKSIRLVPVGNADRALLPAVAFALGRELRTRCTIGDRSVDPSFARHPERAQYFSTAIIERLAAHAPAPSGAANHDEILIGVTDVDLYIPILTFVFGEAQLGGRCALVSYHRLFQEFYGLPPDRDVLLDRLIKETVHEAGHVAGLTHCDDYECVMAASHAVEWLDLKRRTLCAVCRDAFRNTPL